MRTNNSSIKNKHKFNVAEIHPEKKEYVKQILDSFHIPYYIPSDDNTLSFSFRHIFRLPNLINLILLQVDSSSDLHFQSKDFLPLNYYLQFGETPFIVTEMQYRLFYFVIHRETPGIVLDAEGVKPGRKINIRITDGIFKGFEGVLPVDPKDGYALVLEIPPLFSWQIPVEKQNIEVLRHPAHITKY